jgi:fibronectin-binding autotransporter adhesin
VNRTTIRTRRDGLVSRLRPIVAMLPVALIAWYSPSSMAADRYWSGTGTWSTGTSNWGTVSGGPYTTGTWSNSPADAAFFEGTAGTVTLGSAITAAGLTFSVPGYTVSGGTLTLSGSSVNAAADATIASRISTSVGLRKTGAGTLTLSGVRDFTGTATTTIDSGTLKIVSVGFLGALGTTTMINAGTLEISSTAANALGSTSSRPITMAAGATLLAANTVINTNAHNLGPLTINGGTLSSNAVSSNNFGNFVLRAVTVGGSVRSTIQSTDIALASGTQTWTVNDATDGTDLLVTSRILTGGNATAILKAGAGTLELTGSNVYSLGTIINAGTVIAGHASAMGTGTASFTGHATLQMGVSGTIANPFSIASAVSGTFDTAGQNTTLFGTVGGAGALVKAGAGRLTLSASNAYSGLTTVSTGTLALSGNGNIAASSGVNLAASGAVLDVSGASGDRTIGSLTGAAGSTVTLGGNTLTAGGTPNSTFTGVISGSGGFTKSGLGVLTLSNAQLFSGAARITAGTLAIGGSNTLAAASRIDVSQGAVLSATTAGLAVVNAQTLGGYGTIDGGVTFLGGSILSPGGSVGELSQTGAAVFSGNASYLFEITNPTGVPGTGWDLFTTDSLSITASSSSPYLVSLTSLTTGTSSTPGPMTGWNPDTSYAWLLVNTNSSITGFDPAAFTIDTTNFTPYNDVNGMFSIARGDTVTGGNATELYVVYAAVPEPAGLALAGIGLAVTGWLARRRRPL